MDYTTIPNDITGLIQWLDKQYPDKCPRKDMTDREIWIAVGERQVVESLIAKLKVDEQAALEGE